jgi:hypothetical protein
MAGVSVHVNQQVNDLAKDVHGVLSDFVGFRTLEIVGRVIETTLLGIADGRQASEYSLNGITPLAS